MVQQVGKGLDPADPGPDALAPRIDGGNRLPVGQRGARDPGEVSGYANSSN
ncbi:MAG: hypothetical protein ACRDJU_13420 [Actinomycetota bacterium]